MEFGKLNLIPARERPDLVAESVAEGLKSITPGDIYIAEIDPSLAGTKEFCEHYEIPVDHAANCVVVEATRGDRKWFAACVVLGATRADINGLVRRYLDGRKVSFASMDEALQKTRMMYGGITPVGLPTDWPILVDSAIVALDKVVVGGGGRSSKLVLSGKILSELPNAVVLEGLGFRSES